MKSRFAACSVAILLLALATAAQRQGFTVGKVTAAAGSRASGMIEVPAGVDDATQIPVTIIHGARPGPVLALIAGTHGYEYVPIVAMQHFPAKVNPTELSGTIIVVHVANMPSFLARTIYYSPVDGKNLNRVYPGKADGSSSERIAHAITREVIDRADYVIDLHCGDGNEDLRPYSYWMTSGSADVSEKSKQINIVFGLPYIVIDDERSPDPAKSVYTSNTAITRGKPSTTTETGGLGRVDDASIGLAIEGSFNLLRHFKMLPGQAMTAQKPLWIDKSEVLRASATGIWNPRVKSDQKIAHGEVIGVLTDFFGNTIQEVRAPFAGIMLYVVATPPVKKDEPLGMVGSIKKD